MSSIVAGGMGGEAKCLFFNLFGKKYFKIICFLSCLKISQVLYLKVPKFKYGGRVEGGGIFLYGLAKALTMRGDIFYP